MKKFTLSIATLVLVLGIAFSEHAWAGMSVNGKYNGVAVGQNNMYENVQVDLMGIPENDGVILCGSVTITFTGSGGGASCYFPQEDDLYFNKDMDTKIIDPSDGNGIEVLNHIIVMNFAGIRNLGKISDATNKISIEIVHGEVRGFIYYNDRQHNARVVVSFGGPKVTKDIPECLKCEACCYICTNDNCLNYKEKWCLEEAGSDVFPKENSEICPDCPACNECLPCPTCGEKSCSTVPSYGGGGGGGAGKPRP